MRNSRTAIVRLFTDEKIRSERLEDLPQVMGLEAGEPACGEPGLVGLTSQEGGLCLTH